MKNLLSAVLLLCFTHPVFAQSYYTVYGKVVSAETQQPLQGASVFAQNTTLGTATDADGNFRLSVPDGGYTLAITYTGFNTESIRINNSDGNKKDVVYELSKKEKQMEEVAIVATTEVKDGWEKYGSFFLNHFIGQTANSERCTIKNPEVVHFYFSKKRNRLKVLATEPLLIENLSLGYNIHYSMDSFTHEYDTEVSLYTGYPLFEELSTEDPAEQQQWFIARQNAYRGSILHFMRSLYNQTLKQDGFEVQFIVKSDKVEKAIPVKDFYKALRFSKDDSTGIVEIFPSQQRVGVIFTKSKPPARYIAANPNEPAGFQFSMLGFTPEDNISIEQNGYYYDQNFLSISAYWGWEKMADQLPYNYIPMFE
jgi:hypothetical protein